MTTITTRIVKIGNSQGIRIPKLLLDQVDFSRDVELVVQDQQIVIRRAKTVREGWEAHFQQMAAQNDDVLLNEVTATDWDDEAWEWT